MILAWFLQEPLWKLIYWMLSFFLQWTQGPKQIGKTLPLYTPRFFSCIPGAFAAPTSSDDYHRVVFLKSLARSSKTMEWTKNTSKPTCCLCTVEFLTWKLHLGKPFSSIFLPGSAHFGFLLRPTKFLRQSCSRFLLFCAAAKFVPSSFRYGVNVLLRGPPSANLHLLEALPLVRQYFMEPSLVR